MLYQVRGMLLMSIVMVYVVAVVVSPPLFDQYHKLIHDDSSAGLYLGENLILPDLGRVAKLSRRVRGVKVVRWIMRVISAFQCLL